MEESTNITSGGDAAIESTPAPQPASEPAYAAHETDITPDSGQPEAPTYEPQTEQPIDLYEKMERYKERGQTDVIEGPPETWREQIQRRKESGFEGEQQPAQAFDPGGSFNSFVQQPQDGALPFLTGLYENNRDTYTRFLSDAVLSQPEYTLALLADRGYIPAEYAPRPAMVDPADPWLSDLSPEHREIALGLDPETWEEVALMAPEIRDRVLEGAAELQRHQQAEQERERQADEKAWRGVVAKGAEGTSRIIDEHMAGHMLHLEQAFSPSGDKDANSRMHQSILALATLQVMQDPEARVEDHNIYAHSMRAAYARSVGDHSRALGHESSAKYLAQKLNARITEARDAYVNLFRPNFGAGGRWPAQTDQPQQYIN